MFYMGFIYVYIYKKCQKKSAHTAQVLFLG